MKLDTKKSIDLYIGGTLLVILRPLVVLLGKILGRDHDTEVKGDITIFKLQGGGSLVIGLGALLAIKQKYPQKNLQIVTTKGIAPFARTLGVFDNILILDDSSFLTLFKSSAHVLMTLFRTDTIIDWEVYSRLTTVFALITCARNRIGFYREDVKNRRYFSTHLIFFNLYYGSYYFYEELARLIGCSIPPQSEVRDYFFKISNFSDMKDDTVYRVAIGAGCSDLSPERMLSAKQWKHFITKELLSKNGTRVELIFLGGPIDKLISDEAIQELKKENLQNISFSNLCGQMPLKLSVEKLSQCHEYWGIDSALLHYARLMQIPTHAFFGPTSPQSLLKSDKNLKETVHYKQVPCSPCVHVTESPPCQGKNICIQGLFED